MLLYSIYMITCDIMFLWFLICRGQGAMLNKIDAIISTTNTNIIM